MITTFIIVVLLLILACYAVVRHLDKQEEDEVSSQRDEPFYEREVLTAPTPRVGQFPVKNKPRWRDDTTKKNYISESNPNQVTDLMMIAALANDSVFDRSHTVDVPDSPTTGFEGGFGGGGFSGGGGGGSWGSDSSSSSSSCDSGSSDSSSSSD